MMNLFKFLLSTQLKLKHSQLTQKKAGFTLIELLVAMIMAVLVITPLLGFMINLLNTDRQEQAKAISEQEVQNALEYIAEDLKEAFYVYDANGLRRVSQPTTPTTSGINNQIPPSQTVPGCNTSRCVPVLVFWKRRLMKDAVPVGTTSIASCPPPTTQPATAPDNCDDAFVYSLVGYYLNTDPDTAWSNSARIVRFELKDGVRNNLNAYVAENDPQKGRDRGFKLFDRTTVKGDRQAIMNSWQKVPTEGFTKGSDVLVDYIDQSTTSTPPRVSCRTALGVTDTTQTDLKLTTPPLPDTQSSFYACVDSTKDKPIVQVYLRGNALARIGNINTVCNSDKTYSAQCSTFFPSVSVRVQGRSFLNVD